VNPASLVEFKVGFPLGYQPSSVIARRAKTWLFIDRSNAKKGFQTSPAFSKEILSTRQSPPTASQTAFASSTPDTGFTD